MLQACGGIGLILQPINEMVKQNVPLNDVKIIFYMAVELVLKFLAVRQLVKVNWDAHLSQEWNSYKEEDVPIVLIPDVELVKSW